MKILVFGAGGIGSVLGGFLARMGHEVSLLGRSWHLDVIEKKGLSIRGIWGDYTIKALELYSDIHQVIEKNTKFDLILLTVKSFDTQEAVGELKALMGPETTLLSFQNGLGNIEAVLGVVHPDQYLVGRAIFGVEIEPGIVNVTVQADPLAIGALPEANPARSPHQVAAVFNLSKLEARAVPNILTFVWVKVIYNCALNALCTLHEIPYGDLLKDPKTRQRMETIVQECYEVGIKSGIPLEPKTSQEYVELLTGSLIPKTASHFPSMLRDIQKGKRTEIEFLNGAICRLGEGLGIKTPVNREMADRIKAKESGKGRLAG